MRNYSTTVRTVESKDKTLRLYVWELSNGLYDVLACGNALTYDGAAGVTVK